MQWKLPEQTHLKIALPEVTPIFNTNRGPSVVYVRVDNIDCCATAATCGTNRRE